MEKFSISSLNRCHLVKIFVMSLCCLPYVLEGYGSSAMKSVAEFCLFFPVSICIL